MPDNKSDKKPEKKPAAKRVMVRKPAEKTKLGMGKRIARYFRETKSEFKKIVWPTPKQLVNNTAVVITTVLIIGAFVFAVDQVLAALLKLILRA